MRTQHRICSTICLTLLLCSLLLGYTSSADAQKVHACLVLLGNDRNITESVAINEDAMIELMLLVSSDAEVHMTLMKSEPGRKFGVRNTVFVNTKITDEDFPKQQDIIEPTQVTDWIRNLKVGASDTVLVYFNGHGKMDRYGTHQLLFDNRFDKTKKLARHVVLEALEATPCRLKLLITDTCSEVPRGTRPAGGADLAQYGGIEAKPQFYARHLFLEHAGTLDITATSPEIRTDSDTDLAYGDGQVGGFFTYALTTALVPAADDNEDDFLSWEEVFAATVAGTQRLCETHPVVKAQNIIQKPVAHTLPMRAELAGGDGSAPPRRPDTIAATAILNFTSTPSGAEVEIDGYVVGKTPLNGYELETDGQSTKNIEVTIKAAGYTDTVKKFRVPRGKPFEWNFELTKKMPEIPETIIGQDGAEMVWISGGEFQMGSNDGEDDEKPVYTVYVDAFYMDKYEVTNAAYKKFLDANPAWQKGRIDSRFHDGNYLEFWNGNNYPQGKANHPVLWVSWYAAMAYAEWANKRLPTEAEWEYAARGGLKGKKYPNGNTLTAQNTNFNSNVGDTTPVGKYTANGYGLYDMAGNVWEWCLDAYGSDFYSTSSRNNPLSGANSIQQLLDNYTGVNSDRVLRGGSWNALAHIVRAAYRGSHMPSCTHSDVGFRCARTVK